MANGAGKLYDHIATLVLRLWLGLLMLTAGWGKVAAGDAGGAGDAAETDLGAGRGRRAGDGRLLPGKRADDDAVWGALRCVTGILLPPHSRDLVERRALAAAGRPLRQLLDREIEHLLRCAQDSLAHQGQAGRAEQTPR